MPDDESARTRRRDTPVEHRRTRPCNRGIDRLEQPLNIKLADRLRILRPTSNTEENTIATRRVRCACSNNDIAYHTSKYTCGIFAAANSYVVSIRSNTITAFGVRANIDISARSCYTCSSTEANDNVIVIGVSYAARRLRTITTQRSIPVPPPVPTKLPQAFQPITTVWPMSTPP